MRKKKRKNTTGVSVRRLVAKPTPKDTKEDNILRNGTILYFITIVRSDDLKIR